MRTVATPVETAENCSSPRRRIMTRFDRMAHGHSNRELESTRLSFRLLPQQSNPPPYLFLTESRTFLLRSCPSLSGTMVIYIDGALKLPLDSRYPLELNRLRRQSGRIAEIVHRANRNGSGRYDNRPVPHFKKAASLLTFIKIAVNYAADKKITHLICMADPKRYWLYRIVGFVPLSKQPTATDERGTQHYPLVLHMQAATGWRSHIRQLFLKRRKLANRSIVSAKSTPPTGLANPHHRTAHRFL
jgi:hypothetical protein